MVRGVALVPAESSQALRTVAVVIANLSAFGLLWMAQYVVADKVIFRQ